jgi:hypothetical protein
MRWIIAGMVGLAMLLAGPAGAMTFKLATTSTGVHVVVAKGDIKAGDAARLARALEGADRDRHGTKYLYLESEGGLVVEALKMADIIHEAEVSTIVRKGTICASACASVLFVAGKYRTVEKGGLLAIHSCYDSRNGRSASECNAVIAAYADGGGVSGPTLMALQEVSAGSDTVIVFEADDAKCFGLTLKPGARPSKKAAPCVKQLMGQ